MVSVPRLGHQSVAHGTHLARPVVRDRVNHRAEALLVQQTAVIVRFVSAVTVIIIVVVGGVVDRLSDDTYLCPHHRQHARVPASPCAHSHAWGHTRTGGHHAVVLVVHRGDR